MTKPTLHAGKSQKDTLQRIYTKFTPRLPFIATVMCEKPFLNVNNKILQNGTQHLVMLTSRIEASDLAKIIELLMEQQKAEREEQKAQREEQKLQ
uniref:Uncharacterized protein n=1 Tax=Romanomermis culicivorax TaxID=13658 RepID=A0A915HMH4_ROMCU